MAAMIKMNRCKSRSAHSRFVEDRPLTIFFGFFFPGDMCVYLCVFFYLAPGDTGERTLTLMYECNSKT